VKAILQIVQFVCAGTSNEKQGGESMFDSCKSEKNWNLKKCKNSGSRNCLIQQKLENAAKPKRVSLHSFPSLHHDFQEREGVLFPLFVKITHTTLNSGSTGLAE
jgi:hypothetical protein